MQFGYRYDIDAARLREPDTSCLLEPREIFARGVFGGFYFEQYRFPSEFPHEWGFRAKRSPRYDFRRNKYRIDTRVGGRMIVGTRTADDPRGFLQWWMRYAMGRRLPTDDYRFQELAHYLRLFQGTKATTHVRVKHRLQSALEFGLSP